jgi:acyl carrier protein
MSNRDKLKDILVEILVLEEGEFRFDLMREDVNSWDSLAIVALAVGIEETFGYHMKPDEALAIRGVQDIINLLESKGISFDEQARSVDAGKTSHL